MAYDAWVSAVTYSVGDYVTNNTTDYVCTYSHTSEIDGIFEPGVGTHWELAWREVSTVPEAQWGIGTKLKRGDGGDPETFSAIAKITNISGPSLSLDTEDTTDHDSKGGWEEIIPTILRSGEVSLDLNFLPTETTQTNLILDMINRAKRSFQMVFPDQAQTTWSFSAYVIGFESEEPTDSALSATVTLKISGEPTIANVNDS